MATTLMIDRYTSPAEAFFVNSYWIETEVGNIILDTQFLISQARQLRAVLDQTGKPIIAVIITHPHPDHYNGTETLLEGLDQVPVYATQPTLDGIRETEGPKREQWAPTYGNDYPARTLFPTHIVASGERVTIGGVEILFQDIGVAETSNQTLLILTEQQILFCGDLVYNQVHPWLVEGHSSAWLERLGYVLATYPKITAVYPGHGQPTTLLGLNTQIKYVNLVQALVRGILEDHGAMTEEGRDTIKKAIEAQYPNQPLAMLYDANIDGITKELLGHR